MCFAEGVRAGYFKLFKYFKSFNSDLPWAIIYSFFKKNFYYFICQRERECVSRERERQTPGWGGSPIPGPWDYNLSRRQMLDHLSPPGAPQEPPRLFSFTCLTCGWLLGCLKSTGSTVLISTSLTLPLLSPIPKARRKLRSFKKKWNFSQTRSSPWCGHSPHRASLGAALSSPWPLSGAIMTEGWLPGCSVRSDLCHWGDVWAGQPSPPPGHCSPYLLLYGLWAL